MKPVIAVDFDETITDNTPPPGTGRLRPEAALYLRKLHEMGCTLVLWTARREPYYSECLIFLKNAGLYDLFDFFYDERGATGKLIADYYIDDRAFFGQMDWRRIYDYISIHLS